jgi:ribosomal protein S18 acetylase RimI-like enzyme
VQVRPAQPGDARGIAEVHVRTWQATYPGIVPDEYLASLSIEKYEAMWHDNIVKGAPRIFVAVDPGEVLGWVAYGPSRDEGAAANAAEIWAIYVATANWGKGIGRQLWEHARGDLVAMGFATISLWAFPENERAGVFYKALGFEAEPGAAKKFNLGGAELNEVRYVRTL